MNVKMTFKSTAPLLMHNPRLADPLDEFTRGIKKLAANRKKTDDIYEQMAELEFRGGLYFSETLSMPYVGQWSIKKCLIEGGRLSKSGKQVERGLLMGTVMEWPVIYPEAPLTVDQLWKDKKYHYSSQVGINGSRVTRMRPKFNEWTIDVVAEIDDELLNLEDLGRVGEAAGKYIGMGDGRALGFGKFEFAVKRTR